LTKLFKIEESTKAQNTGPGQKKEKKKRNVCWIKNMGRGIP